MDVRAWWKTIVTSISLVSLS